MAAVSHLNDVTTDSFEQMVVKTSYEAPVLVDFWAPWCGPCRSLSPILEKLAGEYQGRFTVAKINTDDEQMLAGQLGIRSLPTVMLVKDGQQVDGFVGVQPEHAIREMLDRHGITTTGEPVAEADARGLEQARSLLAGGQTEEAAALLRTLSADEPDDYDLQLELAGALLQTGASDEVEKILAGLPAEVRDGDAAKAIDSRMAFAAAVAAAPDLVTLRQQVASEPGNLQARYQLGVRLLISGDYAAALEQFLDIMKRDRTFQEDLGRRSLVDAFRVVDDPALISRYRQKMATLLF